MMTVHVLHAGDGYTYLTRQVAAGDHTVRRGEDLTEYYTAEGNPVGQWLGSGLANLGVSGTVSEEQMQALFGDGLPRCRGRHSGRRRRGSDPGRRRAGIPAGAPVPAHPSDIGRLG